MFRSGGVRLVVAFTLVTALAGPACALAAGSGAVSRGPASWLAWSDLWDQAQRWWSALLPRTEGVGGDKAGSSIDPNGKPGLGQEGGGSGTNTNSEGGGYGHETVP